MILAEALTRTSKYTICVAGDARSARPVWPRLDRDMTASVIPPTVPAIQAWMPADAGIAINADKPE